MSQQLQAFAQKHMREVEEGVPAARKITLQGEGQVFETWQPVLGMDPIAWTSEARTLLDALADELPKRRCQMTFTAEDVSGAPLGQCLISVTGKNAAVQDLGTQNGAKALADALASVSKTMDAVLTTARGLMEFQSVQLAKAMDQNLEYVDLFQAMQKVQVESSEQESAASQMLVKQVENAMPTVMMLVQHLIANAGNTKGMGGGVAAAAAAAAAATNGKVATS